VAIKEQLGDHFWWLSMVSQGSSLDGHHLRGTPFGHLIFQTNLCPPPPPPKNKKNFFFRFPGGGGFEK